MNNAIIAKYEIEISENGFATVTENKNGKLVSEGGYPLGCWDLIMPNIRIENESRIKTEV